MGTSLPATWPHIWRPRIPLPRKKSLEPLAHWHLQTPSRRIFTHNQRWHCLPMWSEVLLRDRFRSAFEGCPELGVLSGVGAKTSRAMPCLVVPCWRREEGTWERADVLRAILVKASWEGHMLLGGEGTIKSNDSNWVRVATVMDQIGVQMQTREPMMTTHDDFIILDLSIHR